MLRDKHGVDNILIADENFGADRETTRELAVELGKLGITWHVAGVRARTVTESDLQLWADNNSHESISGIESGSEKILEIMEKSMPPSRRTSTRFAGLDRRESQPSSNG